MEQLYSTGLEDFKDELPIAVKEALGEIGLFFQGQQCRLLKWEQNYIVVPVSCEVSLPTRGAVNGVDIRSIEPILIQIHINHYPDVCPMIMSDRLDFPRNSMPQLYARESGKPAAFCLVRNDPNEWFATIRMSDLLIVATEWLHKAASGRLVNDGQEWDPIRGNYSGQCVYKYDALAEIVTQDQRFLPVYSFAILLSTLNGKKLIEESIVLRVLNAVPFIQLPILMQTLQKISDEGAGELTDLPTLSLLIWSDTDSIENEYFVNIPVTYGQLKQYFAIRGIDLADILAIYIKSLMHRIRPILIIHAIRRSAKLIGFDNHIEFINFIMVPDFTQVDFPDNTEVKTLRHIEPFSKELAEKMTEENRNAKTLFAGAGSLGSKIFMHDLRSGKLFMAVADQDEFLQHNLTRHTLYSNSVGKNKAIALVEQAKSFFTNSITKDLIALPFRLDVLPPKIFGEYEWLIDTTASFSTLNFLSRTTLPLSLKIARCEIADGGRLGLCYVEGENRNPRLDDLINFTYYLATENKSIEEWRNHDSKKEVTNISIGLGCSSTTSVMADDTISFHAALFSKLLYKQQIKLPQENTGLIYLSAITNEFIPKICNDYFKVRAFDIFPCGAGSKWQVRMKNGLKHSLLESCRNHPERETGGVLIGIANYKIFTIHVLAIISEPGGSSGTASEFTRGIDGLDDQVNDIKIKTGGMIGYIGEWHTHPHGGTGLSGKDKRTIIILRKRNRRIPIPTCSVIVTPSDVIPYTFN